MSMKMTKSIANSFKTFGRSFLLCGLCGWCMEILFTALHSLRRRDLRLTVEYLSGRLLWKHDLCPWDYGKSRFHIHRIIRLDYAPWWFLAGLFFEKILP